MAKFAGSARTRVQSPISTTGRGPATFQGAAGWSRDVKSDLFLLAVTNMVGEQTFYETAGDRDERFRQLIAQAVKEDPAWCRQFLIWLRNDGNMRTAAVVGVAEYAAAGGEGVSLLVPAVLARADEPGELLAYWCSRHGRKIPKGLKRGLARACVKLYSERSTLRYDSSRLAWRFADVIELVHPKAKSHEQNALFRSLLDRRHNRADMSYALLPMLAADDRLNQMTEAQRHAELESGEQLAAAGWSWERVSGWVPGGMTAKAWTAAIPGMGYMALLRNLRNFEQAGLDPMVMRKICARLEDPEEVARSRQFPLRFLTAYREAAAMAWGPALEAALNHSLANVPAFPGRTLVLVDVSGSMNDRLSARSTVCRAEAAGLFGAAVALRAEHANVYAYDDVPRELRIPPAGSILRSVEHIRSLVRGGTNTWGCAAATYKDHDRVVILTDEQPHGPYGYGGYSYGATAETFRRGLRKGAHVFTFNLAGYGRAHAPSSDVDWPGWHTFGGLTDAGFRLMRLLEQGTDAGWPWERSD